MASCVVNANHCTAVISFDLAPINRPASCEVAPGIAGLGQELLRHATARMTVDAYTQALGGRQAGGAE